MTNAYTQKDLDEGRIARYYVGVKFWSRYDEIQEVYRRRYWVQVEDRATGEMFNHTRSWAESGPAERLAARVAQADLPFTHFSASEHWWAVTR